MEVVKSLINDVLEYPMISLFVSLFLVILFYRMFTNARIYLGTKNYVKHTAKLRRKKHNGDQLVDKIKKKRKRKTNSFQYLRRGAKKRVDLYFNYKEDELIGITNYSYGTLFRRKKHKLTIFVSNGKKKVMKIQLKKASNKFSEITNTYDCLDEFILFLHHLPEAILNRQDYDIYLEDHDVSIGYTVK